MVFGRHLLASPPVQPLGLCLPIIPHLWIAVLVYGDDHAHLTVIIGADRPAVLVARTQSQRLPPPGAIHSREASAWKWWSGRRPRPRPPRLRALPSSLPSPRQRPTEAPRG